MWIRTALLTLLVLGLWSISTAAAAPHAVYLVKLSAPIGPGTADFVTSGIAQAEKADAACVVIQLDTPGGLAESMRTIVMAILGARVPVVVYVAPAGARAASAGVMITMAADIAAMAPGTNIGAAHPVGAGGGDIESTMSEKVVNDMVAQARSVAERRGRNADWVEQAIRASVSITETEALQKRVIDLVADDLDDLLRQIDGREVKDKGVLKVKDAPLVVVSENLRTKVLKAIGDPNIAFILLLIGAAGLYFELAHPGAVFPGVLGGLSLILAIFAFQMLPVNYVGVLLIALAMVLFLLEIKVTSYGLLSVAGVVALFLGALMLYKGDAPEAQLSWQVLIPSVALVSAFFAVVAALAFRAQVATARTGLEGLVGEIGVVRQALAPEGKILVHGELWRARASRSVDPGEKVKVVAADGLLLEVEALAPKAPK
jgi:membrane-bound serine protease (ClpP class)